ncbi:MAG: PstS family phosphate ABC transporter substrate-binding protein [Eubacteriales bacterium]|nr:PstS family phosphate ABC transporter substrate-binding protein [Eubacteriales bacterium]
MKAHQSTFTLKTLISLIMIIALTMTLLAGCSAGASTTSEGAAPAETKVALAAGLSGQIIIDGSSTVFPISEAVSEEFTNSNPDVQVPVGYSGTGGGFKKFIAGETDISNASRPIKDTEAQALKDAGIEYTEIKVAYDGLTVVVNAANDFATDITVDELAKIWAPHSAVMLWSDVRAEWPAEKIGLYGPGSDSGTFEYFTEEITGEAGAIRTDYTPSEDDNVLVQGVAGDKYAMGFFGYAYYLENADKLKALSINGISPEIATIKDGTYSPLSRPLFIYVKNSSLEREEVVAFMDYFLTEGTVLVEEVGYVGLTDAEYATELAKLG